MTFPRPSERQARLIWLAITGLAIAILIAPAVALLEGKGASRPRAIAAVFGIALLVVAALFGSIIPQLVSETRQLADHIPAYAARLTERVEFWVSHPPPWVQKLIERESNPTATPGRVATTNENLPLLTTNVSLA